MMAAKFIVFALLFVACSYASPLRMATLYDSPVFAVPVFVQNLDTPETAMNKEPMRALNDDSKIAEDTAKVLEKRSTEETDDDDLETAAGTNVLRPLFVYRQQIAYRQRAREDASRRGRRI